MTQPQLREVAVDDVYDALDELLAGRSMTVEFLPGQTYRAYAPSRLAQLLDAVGEGLERAGGRGSGGSRALISADAHDLATEIRAVTLDRAVRLRLDVRARRSDLPWTIRATAAELMTRRPWDTAGYLLQKVDELRALARDARAWARRIDVLLVGGTDLLVSRPLRGVPCAECQALYVLDDRPNDGVYRVPAVVLMYSEDARSDADADADADADVSDEARGKVDDGPVLLPFTRCRACGTRSWLRPPVDHEDDSPSQSRSPRDRTLGHGSKSKNGADVGSVGAALTDAVLRQNEDA